MARFGSANRIRASPRQKLRIDWIGFSIGGKSRVSFDNGSGATPNRVTGGNLSRIAGSLHATGSLYLINSQGVIVSGTGKVITGGNTAPRLLWVVQLEQKM